MAQAHLWTHLSKYTVLSCVFICTSLLHVNRKRMIIRHLKIANRKDSER